MSFFNYSDNGLRCEGTPVAQIVREVGTPVYVYSKSAFVLGYRKVAQAFAPVNGLICYSIKSCGNVNILRILAGEGCGFDVTSGGELYRAIEAGADPKKIIFAGVGKTDDEIRAGLGAGIAAFNIESEEEIETVDRIAGEMKLRVTGALRVNPDVDPRTHAKTTTGKRETKFGVDLERAASVFERYRNLRHLRLAGIHIHIGSPVRSVQPYVDAVAKVMQLINQLTSSGHQIAWLDIGGGFSADSADPSIAEHAEALLPLLRSRSQRVAVEPGRYIAANAGILLTRVLYRKQSGDKRFIIVDAGMNDFIRPTLYDAHHEIRPATFPWSDASEVVDIVGPVCETGDFFAQSRAMPIGLKRGDLLAIFSAGAYGFSMSSNYNNRPRAAEVLVDGESFQIIRRRESLDDLIALERAKP